MKFSVANKIGRGLCHLRFVPFLTPKQNLVGKQRSIRMTTAGMTIGIVWMD